MKTKALNPPRYHFICRLKKERPLTATIPCRKDIALPFNGGTPAQNYSCRSTFIELLAGDNCRNRCRLAPNADSLKTDAFGSFIPVIAVEC